MPPTIRLTNRTTVPEESVTLRFIRASGPGGQNVQKVATAVQLRLHLDRAGLPEDVRGRLERLAGRRLTQEGEILIEAQRFRTQERNREDALTRLAALLARAEHEPKPRLPTKPSRAARARRTEEKTRHGDKKRMRRAPRAED